MIKKIFNKHKSLSLILGSISVLALPPYYFLPIAFITFGLLFFILLKAQTKKQGFAIGYFFGFGFYAFGLSWIGNALLISPQSTGWLYPICFFASGAFFGLFIGFPTLIAQSFKNTYHKYFALITSIVFFEWIRSWIFTGFPWNPIGSFFGFNTTLIQTASIGGVFFTSLIVLYIITLPALYIATKNKKTIIFFVLLILATTGFGIYKTTSYQYKPSQTQIRLVQPAIPQTMKWDPQILENNFAKHINMSAVNNDNIDITIWGETASPFPLDIDKVHMQQITKAIPKNGYLITGALRYEFKKDGSYTPLNSMLIIDENTNIAGYYDKSHLVPFGEYIPLRKYLPDFIQPVVNIIGSFKAGDGPKTTKLKDLPSFASSICYEIIFPNANIDRQNKPQFLINLTNDGWYGISAGPYQHLLTAQFRAIEEGITTIRVANTGISAMILPTGKIHAQIPLNKSEALDVFLPSKPSINTIYCLLQNYLILCIMILTLITLIYKEHKNGK